MQATAGTEDRLQQLLPLAPLQQAAGRAQQARRHLVQGQARWLWALHHWYRLRWQKQAPLLRGRSSQAEA